MNTDGRLMRAYKSAQEIQFDNTSKIVFLSDVHRGDNSLSDEFAHNQNIYYHALNHYYNEGYTYIEVGDGDELWEHAKFEHIRSAHSDVYWLLSQFHEVNRLIMLYGNHNMHFRNPQFVEKNLQEFYDEYLEERGTLFPEIKVHESIILRHFRYRTKDICRSWSSRRFAQLISFGVCQWPGCVTSGELCTLLDLEIRPVLQKIGLNDTKSKKISVTLLKDMALFLYVVIRIDPNFLIQVKCHILTMVAVFIQEAFQV